MVAIEGAIIPAPLVVPPMLQPASSVCTACFATVSVVMIAVAAASPAAASAPSAAAAASTPASTAVARELLADQPGGTDRDLDGAAAEDLGGLLGGGVRGLETFRPGARVRTAGVEDDGPQPAGGEHLLRPQHRGRLDLVAGEHAGGGVRGAVVDDQREVEAAGGLDPGGDPGGPEALGGRRRSRCHPGQRQAGGLRSPRARFMHCTAPPAVPLVRLSIAATATSRRASGRR